MNDRNPDPKNPLRPCIDSLRPLYPYGVPMADDGVFIEAVERGQPNVLFLVDELSSEGRVLLENAVVKGMKLTLEDVEIRSVSEYKGTERVPWVVCFGNEVGSKVCYDWEENTWGVGPQARFLKTESLSAILATPESKRKFWNHLQNLMSKLEL